MFLKYTEMKGNKITTMLEKEYHKIITSKTDAINFLKSRENIK